jgi:hypothetical protein
VLPALLQVVADGVQLVLGPVAGHDAQRLAELRPQPGLYGGRVGGSDDQYRLVLAGMEQGDCGCRAGAGEVTRVVRELDVAAAFGCGQPPSGGGHGGVTQRACAAGSGTGVSCRSTRSCSPDQVPVTVAQPSTEPSFSKRAATASKSAPATRTAPFHTGLTRRSRPPGSAIGRVGWNQSPRSFRTRRPVAAAGRRCAQPARQHPYRQVITPSPVSAVVYRMPVRVWHERRALALG